MGTKILIVGATGLVGGNLVQACKAEGIEIHALVRPQSLTDSSKVDPLRANGATIHEGSLEDYDSLLKACSEVEVVISAAGGMQISLQPSLVKAGVEAGVKRFIPSDYGGDPKVTERGSSMLFDAKSAIHKVVKEANLNYTFVHANLTFEAWLYGLGQIGLPSPPEEVQLYGNGSVKGALVSVADTARVTVAAADDPRTLNKEVFIAANVHTQEELIKTWESKSGRSVKRIPVTLEEIEKKIAESNQPEKMMDLIIGQLTRSAWFLGEFSKHGEGSLDAAELYPDIQFTTVEQAFAQLA